MATIAEIDRRAEEIIADARILDEYTDADILRLTRKIRQQIEIENYVSRPRS